MCWPLIVSGEPEFESTHFSMIKEPQTWCRAACLRMESTYALADDGTSTIESMYNSIFELCKKEDGKFLSIQLCIHMMYQTSLRRLMNAWSWRPMTCLAPGTRKRPSRPTTFSLSVWLLRPRISLLFLRKLECGDDAEKSLCNTPSGSGCPSRKKGGCFLTYDLLVNCSNALTGISRFVHPDWLLAFQS